MDTDRVHAEQIRLLYRSGPVGVVGAMLGAFGLAAVVQRMHAVPVGALRTWLCVVGIDVALHLLLARAYAHAADRDARWRFWASGFTAFSLLEGLIWGVTAFYVVVPGALDRELLVMDVVCAVTAGAVSAFGVFLPAFYVLLLPATIPFGVASLVRGGVLGDWIAGLVVIYTVAMLLVAHRHNGNLLEMLRLRFENLDLASALRAQKDAAEAASQAKTRFLAAASHDLRQPVHALGLFVGALRGHRLDPEPARLVDLIEQSVSAMDDLFGAILDISRLDAGIVAAEPRSFPVQSLLERLRRDYATEAAAKGLSLRVRPCPAHIISDPVLLERILRNLVSNALRYTDRGGVLIACRVGATPRIEVWDTGCGIAEAQRERVFEEFFQVQNPERDRSQGLGLGLAIVRRIAQLLGHRVTLRSRPGRGSVFSVGVRLDRAPPRPDWRPLPGAARRGLILVVDDEAAIREGMRSLLVGWGHTVLCAGSGDEMFARLQALHARPDLVICDYRLRGDETGVHVVHRLRARYGANLPALLITGDTAPDRLGEAAGSGLLLLHKPVANSRLRAAVNNLLRIAAAADEA